MMKVLHVITSLSDGGAQAVLYRLCKRDEHDEHIVVSMMDPGKYGPLLAESGVTVLSLGLARDRLTPAPVLRLRHLIGRHGPDVVQTWMYHADLLGGVASRLAGARTVWGIHHSDLVPGKSKRITILVARLCAVFSHFIPTRIICCSERAAEVHQELGYAAGKISVVPNGYDVRQFSPDPSARTRVRAEWHTDGKLPVIGMVARYNPQKDHASLIRALGELQRSGTSFLCVMIGDGINENNSILIDLLKQENVIEKVLLYEHRNDIPDVMNALDIHILSSAYGEAFPNVLCEAMSCGTPCVTTDVGDAARIVGDTGWVLPPGKPHALATAILNAFDEMLKPDDWSARQETARRHIIEHFSLETMVDSYRTIWSACLKK